MDLRTSPRKTPCPLSPPDHTETFPSLLYPLCAVQYPTEKLQITSHALLNAATTLSDTQPHASPDDPEGPASLVPHS